MSIDLTIPGDVGAIRALADWLAPSLKDAVVESDVDLVWLHTDSEHYWSGMAGMAFRNVVQDIRRPLMPISSYLGDAASVFRAYANRLERGRDDFQTMKDQASTAGFTVAGNRVHAPSTSLTYCPGPGAPAEDRQEYAGYLNRIELYKTLSSYVGTWWGELEAWIAENMVPLAVQIDEFGAIRNPLEGLTVGNDAIVTTALDANKRRIDADLRGFRKTANDLQADYQKFKRGLRSGNPALRAASQAANPQEIRAGLNALTENIGRVSRYSKLLPVAGGVVEVVAAGVEIAQGGSPSSVGVGVAGGAAGGALAGWALAGAAIPPVGAALAVGGVAVAAGSGATWLYEAWTPLDVRESIDDFFTGAPPRLSNIPSSATPAGTYPGGGS